MDSSKESTSFINQGVFAILPEEQLFSHIVSHPIVRNMKWSFLAFIPKQTRRRRWTPCLIFLLEAPEWLAAGLNTGSSDNKTMESRQVSTRSKWLSSNLRDWIRSNWSRQDQLAENCPVSVQADLRQLYSSVCELIRWWLYYLRWYFLINNDKFNTLFASWTQSTSQALLGRFSTHHPWACWKGKKNVRDASKVPIG